MYTALPTNIIRGLLLHFIIPDKRHVKFIELYNYMNTFKPVYELFR